MHEGFLAPVGLVEVEAILLRLPVEGNQALVVHARFAALIPGIGSKVKHVPHMGCPHVGMTIEAPHHEFMILCLVLFRVIIPVRMGGMQIRHTLSAILTVPQATIGVAQVEESNPQVIQEQAGHVPAQIQVPADHVRNVGTPVEGTAHGIAGQSGEPGRIRLMHQVIQHMMVIQHVLLVLGGNGDFIGHTPADDAGVVVVLLNQFLHLNDGVGTAFRHVLTDVGDFRPHHHAVAVAQVIEVLIMLIVSQANGVGTQLTDQLHILIVHGTGNSIAHTLPILMAGHAVERIRLIVQEEALLGIRLEGTYAEGNGQRIRHFMIHYHLHPALIEVRILYTMPAVCLFHMQRGVCSVPFCHGIALGVQQGDVHLSGGNTALHPDIGTVSLGQGRYPNAAGTQIVQGKVCLVDHNQPNPSVNAAIEGEVRLLGIDLGVLAVVHVHMQIVFILKERCNLCTEGGIAAVVGAKRLAVQRHSRRSIDAVKLQPHFFAGRIKRRLGKGMLVVTSAPLVVIAPILSVNVVPRVGNGNFDGLAVKTRKVPGLTKLYGMAHDAPPHCELVAKEPRLMENE